MTLTEPQCAFFETFGFLVLPGLMAEELPWIYEGFDDIFSRLPERHDGTRRTIAGTDSSEKLCRLLDHPKIVGALSSLLGDDFNYSGRGRQLLRGRHGLALRRLARPGPVREDGVLSGPRGEGHGLPAGHPRQPLAWE